MMSATTGKASTPGYLSSVETKSSWGMNQWFNTSEDFWIKWAWWILARIKKGVMKAMISYLMNKVAWSMGWKSLSLYSWVPSHVTASILFSFVTALFSPDDLFVLIEGFWRLVVFDEA
jgi:hypothetical protein